MQERGYDGGVSKGQLWQRQGTAVKALRTTLEGASYEGRKKYWDWGVSGEGQE